MLKKLKAVLRLWVRTGDTLSYDSTKALIQRTLLEFRKLQERRRFLEEHMKPWYSEAQYQVALYRIEAYQRRLLAKLKCYFDRIDEIGAAVEGRDSELGILAADSMCEDRDELRSAKPRDREAMTRAESEKPMRRLELLNPGNDNDDV